MNWLLRFVLLAALAAALGTQSPPGACALCTDAAIACPTCAGAGVESVPCFSCSGSGKSKCLRCGDPRPGYVRCTNAYCRDGKARWAGGDTDPCKLCSSKGRLPCARCAAGKAPDCSFCEGAGKRARTCSMCAGRRRLACPRCAIDTARAGCRSCDGTGVNTCGRCRGAPPEGTRPCGRCDGKGDHACVTCEGLSRIACAKCGATGRIRSSVGAVPQLPIPGSKGGVRTCEDCEGRGTAPCGACAKGRMDCALCERGRRPAGCLHCLAAKLVVCEDCCSGGVAADETMGRFLLKAGHLARAAAFFERALVAARALDGPAAAATALAVRSKAASESFAMQREFAKTREDLAETLRSMGVAERRSLATTPPADELTFELLWPRDLLDRHWPKRPQDHPFDPWAAPAWLASHRKRTVKRLEDELAKARATPPPAAK